MEELKRRIARLEEEVALLKAQQTSQDSIKELPEKVAIKKEYPTLQPTKLEEKDVPMLKTEAAVEEMLEKPIAKPKLTPKPTLNLEQLLGKWLPRVFMFILLLGILWGLKVASDYGYFTNALRIAAGYGATALLYYFGMTAFRKTNRIFGATLLSGVIAIGILTTFAAHYLYGYLNAPIAMMIGLAYIAGGIWLSYKTKSEILTLFSAVAAFLLPYLLTDVASATLLFYMYILILFLALFYVSIHLQHKYTFYFTFLLFHLTLVVHLFINFTSYERVALLTIVLLQHFALLIAYVWRKIPRHVFTETLIYTNFGLTLWWMQMFQEREELWGYGLFAVIYIGLTVWAFKRKEHQLGGVLSAVSILAVSVFIFVSRLEEDLVTLLLLLINGTCSIWLGIQFKSVRTLITGSVIYLSPALFIVMMMEIPAFLSLEHGNWIVFLYSVVLIFYALYNSSIPKVRVKLRLVDQWLIVAQLIFMVYIFRVTTFFLSIYLGETFYQQSLVVPYTYLLVFIISLAAMYAMSKWKHGQFVVRAVVIEYLLLGVWLLFERMTLPGMESFGFAKGFGIRLGLFVQVLYIALFLLMVWSIWKERFGILSDKLKENFRTIAFTTQLVLFMFLNKWYLSLVPLFGIREDFYLLMHTFFLFAFAFLSVTIGRKYHWRAVKYAGTILLFICIFKLFFMDLFRISILIRAVLFIAVGIVGLMYSKTFLGKEDKPQSTDDLKE